MEGLDNGTYTLRAQVQSGGGQKQDKIIATDFGSNAELNVAISVTSFWTQVEIPDIHVTSGKCTVAFYTEGAAGNWSCADDFELLRISR